jgi:hypothetical protein
MSPTTIVVVVIVVAAIMYLVAYGNPVVSPGSEVRIVPGSIRGDVERAEGIVLPPSYNQPEGLTYSYACWVLVKDFTVGYGNRRRIFSKDDAPGLYIDSTSNSLLVNISTFGTMETMLIPNIPAQKWIHFALVVDQHAVDVYINGMLREHRTLSQLPKQNDATVKAGGGWSGVLAKLSYWPRSLTSEEVKKFSQEALPDDLDRKPSGPQYFDITWYIGRLYSV